MRKESLVVGCLLSAAGLGVGCSDEPTAEPIATSEHASTAKGSTQVGRHVFFNEFPGVQGNGRACETCHVEADAFQLTPAHVQARWQALQEARTTDPKADDPLFRSVDADDRAGDFTTLRNHALVRIVIKLPTDANGQPLIFPLDDPGATHVEVWRATPSILNTAITAPYQQDGRFATLEDQALGALRDHAEIRRAPNPLFVDAVASWQKTQFSSAGVASVAAALAQGTAPPDPDPVLDDTEQAGKAIFASHCGACHGGPTQTQAVPPLVKLQDIFVSKPLPPFTGGLVFPESPPLNVRLWAVRIPGAPEPVVRPSTDPGKALITGSIEDFNAFDIPSLFGIAKTAQYFHDNSAATLEDALLHYQSLFSALQRVIPEGDPTRPPSLTDDQVGPLLAYLKKI